MARPTLHPEPLQAEAGFVPPYPPSWFDRFTVWVERFPVPWWLFYCLLAAVLVGVVALVLWQAGVYDRVGFHPMQVFLPVLTAYFLGLTHGLDRVAASAMQRFRPAFRGDDNAFSTAVYRMTTLPARSALLFPVIATVVSLPIGMFEFSYMQTGGLQFVPVAFLLILSSFYLAGFVVIYHAFHQLREIHRLYQNHAEVRLVRLRPLYALSQVTSLTALGLVINNYGWIVAQPGQVIGNPVSLAEGAFNLLLALIVFAWPLWGAHRLLVERKEEALDEIGRRMETAIVRLHQRIDEDQITGIDDIHKVIAALETEAATLQKIPTWPWAAGTFRNLVATLLLPMIIWLIQFGLQRFLQ